MEALSSGQMHPKYLYTLVVSDAEEGKLNSLPGLDVKIIVGGLVDQVCSEYYFRSFIPSCVLSSHRF
jgi:hypothetical protein